MKIPKIKTIKNGPARYKTFNIIFDANFVLCMRGISLLPDIWRRKKNLVYFGKIGHFWDFRLAWSASFLSYKTGNHCIWHQERIRWMFILYSEGISTKSVVKTTIFDFKKIEKMPITRKRLQIAKSSKFQPKILLFNFLCG